MKKSLLSAVIMALGATAVSTAAALPETIFAVGDFNGWELPQGDDLNGALTLPHPEDETGGRFSGDLHLPSGTKEFMFCSIDPATGEATFYGNPTKNLMPLPAFTLYNEGPAMEGSFHSSTIRDELQPFRLAGWQGNSISASLEIIPPAQFILKALDGSRFDAPTAENIYLVYSINDGKPQISQIRYNDNESYVWLAEVYSDSDPLVSKNGMDTLSFFFTTENSTSPDPANCWGATEEEEKNALDNKSQWIAIERGNTPIILKYPDNNNASMNIMAYLQSGIAEVETTYNEEFNGPDIYLVGSPQGWDINDDSMALKKDPNSRSWYEGTFHIEAGDPIFRFYTELGNWDANSIGSQVEDKPVEITLTADESYYTQLVEGKGTWKISGWPGGNLNIRLNPEAMMAFFSSDTAEDSVSGVASDPCSAPAYFNLQGHRIDNPTRGDLLIRVCGDRREKIIVP